MSKNQDTYIFAVGKKDTVSANDRSSSGYGIAAVGIPDNTPVNKVPRRKSCKTCKITKPIDFKLSNVTIERIAETARINAVFSSEVWTDKALDKQILQQFKYDLKKEPHGAKLTFYLLLAIANDCPMELLPS